MQNNSLDKNLIREYKTHKSLPETAPICQAPFTSLYFGYEGKVLACCYNRKHELGRYPEKSLKDIWQGSSHRKLMSSIRENDLSLGCELCQYELENKLFDSYRGNIFSKLNIDPKYPVRMEFEIENTCNLECLMCNEKLSSAKEQKLNPGYKSKPKYYGSKFVEELTEYIPYLQEAVFLGGEPFLIGTYYEIWDKLTKLNPDCCTIIQTNGTILTQRAKEILNKGRFGLNISLDSLRKEKYEAIRINADFDKVMENLNYFIGYCKNKHTSLWLTPCVMQQNWEELPDFVDFCNKNELFLNYLIVWEPENCSLKNEKPEKLKLIFAKLNSCNFTENNIFEKNNRSAYLRMLKQIETWSSVA